MKKSLFHRSITPYGREEYLDRAIQDISKSHKEEINNSSADLVNLFSYSPEEIKLRLQQKLEILNNLK
jgi:hypothetical protein